MPGAGPPASSRTASAEPEHRQAAVAFVALRRRRRRCSPSTAPNGLAAALDELVAGVQRVADEHGVTFLETDIDRDGGKIILVAGAPADRGRGRGAHPPHRARDRRPGTTELPLRIGVSRGRVFAGEVGAAFRRTYTILGKTAALAARLMGKAKPGQVLTTADVLERSRSAFETVELEPLTLKGIAEPVEARTTSSAVAAERRRAGRDALPFVGRERELAILVAPRSRPVRMGFGNIVELIGEPGIGKSRLVEELAGPGGGHAAGHRDLRSSTRPRRRTSPSAAFCARCSSCRRTAPRRHDVSAERVAGARPGARCRGCRCVALPLDVPVEPTQEVEELAARVPARAPARRRRVAAREAAGLADAARDRGRALDGRGVRRAAAPPRRPGARPSPWLLCVTRRPVAGGFSAAEGVPPIPALTIQLEPLDARGARSSSSRSRGRGPAPARGRRRSPSARAATRSSCRSSSPAASAAEDEALPGERRGGRRDADRPAAARRPRAAALGVGAGRDLRRRPRRRRARGRAEASADSEAWDRLAEFVERDPYTPGAFRFRHALFRDAAYEGLSFRRRRELHARVGRGVRAARAAATAASTPSCSRCTSRTRGTHEKTWRYSLVAGERAQAEVRQRRGSRRSTGARSRSRAQLDRARAERASPQVWESLGDVSRARRASTRTPGEAYAQRAQARSRAPTAPAEGRRHPRALRPVLRGAALVQRAASTPPKSSRRDERDADALSSSRSRTPACALRQGDVRRLHRAGASACVEDADADATTSPALAHAYYLCTSPTPRTGAPSARRFRGLALPIYEELGDLLGQANVLNNLGIDAYYEGRWDEALDLYERSKRGARADRRRRRRGDDHEQHRRDQVRPGLPRRRARELFEEACDVFETAGYRMLATSRRSISAGSPRGRAGSTTRGAIARARRSARFDEIRAAGYVLETKARLAERAVLAQGNPTRRSRSGRRRR